LLKGTNPNSREKRGKKGRKETPIKWKKAQAHLALMKKGRTIFFPQKGPEEGEPAKEKKASLKTLNLLKCPLEDPLMFSFKGGRKEKGNKDLKKKIRYPPSRKWVPPEIRVLDKSL